MRVPGEGRLGGPPTAKGTALAVLVLALLSTLALFEPLLGTGSLLSVDSRIVPPFVHHAPAGEPARAMNVATTDVNAFTIPETLVSRSQWRRGELPLWNAGQLLGQPLHAGMGFLSFYPTALLDLALPPLRAYALSMALHLVFLGFGTWLLFTRRGLLAGPALLGALTVAFCSFVALRLHLPNLVRAYAWAPWTLLAVDALLAAPGRRSAVALGACLGLGLLAGAPHITALVALVAAAAFVVGLWRRPGGPWSRLAWAGLALSLGGLLAAVLVLPGHELYQHSTRSGADPELASLHPPAHLEPVALAGVLLPHLFGNPVQDVHVAFFDARPLEDFPTTSWLEPTDDNNLVDNAAWLGLIPCVLALLGLARGPRGPDRFWWWTCVLALATVLGLPGMAGLASLLPGFGLGYAKRALCVVAFAAAWLAASTLQRLVSQPSRRATALLAASGAGLLLLGAAGLLPFERWLLPRSDDAAQAWLRDTLWPDLALAAAAGLVLLLAAWSLRRGAPRAALALLVGASGTELVAAARHANPPQSVEHQFETTPGIDWLAAHAEQGRLVSYAPSGALPGSLAPVFGLRSIQGYHPLLGRARYDLFDALDPAMVRVGARAVGAVTRLEALRSPLLDLFAARWVVTSVDGFHQIEAARPEELGLALVYSGEQERLAVYERRSALPPLFLVQQVRLLPERHERLGWLVSPAFEPAREAVVEVPPRQVQPLAPLAGGTLHSSRPDERTIVAEVDCAGPAFLVVSETWFPGWNATIDGAPAPVLRTDHALMGLELPAGRHQVRLRYEPRSFTWGALASALGALVSLILLGVRRGR